jgi:putative acetyltransferase
MSRSLAEVEEERPDGLRKPDVTTWPVLDAEIVVGCGALKRLDASHAELKSMRTAPARAVTGV